MSLVFFMNIFMKRKKVKSKISQNNWDVKREGDGRRLILPLFFIQG